ncbi:T9SS type A sorting domain-containing protein [Rudanella paleaurantiibacter]|uniref:T9SS type A sorting domain-containing protein n=1 Tax=Rudanella paleaurantiibacter TaxID=2614655 RepID=A0A7J5TTU3_9BACT|nr:putative Ig domain-containing protein [Rudanella paleaurantiibacter]KAB7727281.1 T9SS type A sorting domain-containing protein [Rudanella paleaurantiibacter]
MSYTSISLNPTGQAPTHRPAPRNLRLFQVVLGILFTCCLNLNTLAQATWTGATNTNWNTANNWSTGAVPTANVDVIIPDVTNDPTIGNGTGALAKTVEVQAGGKLTIASSASLTVNGEKTVLDFPFTFFNDGTVTNNGNLIIGSTTSSGFFGLWNRSTFNNNSGATIQIDRTKNRGLSHERGTFSNAGRIIIGNSTNIGAYGLYIGDNGGITNGTFTNQLGGEIQIDRSTLSGLYVLVGTFSNSGRLIIGANASVGRYGLGVSNNFTNEASGDIRVDRSTDIILVITTGTIVNRGAIRLGASALLGPNALQVGFIDQTGTFTNEGCSAYLFIDSDKKLATLNGTFTNSGTIVEKGSGNSNITTNSGVVQNLNGGTITITNNTGLLSTQAGALWTGCTNTDWNTATNWSTGAVPTATDDVVILDRPNKPTIGNGTGALAKSIEVQTGAKLTVASSATLTINNSKSISEELTAGFWNRGTVDNSGFIVLGNTASVGMQGLRNEGTFNNTGGTLQIDRSTSRGLHNGISPIGPFTPTLTNSGVIRVGSIADIGDEGLYASGIVTNQAGGVIEVDRATGRSIEVFSTQKSTNQGLIKVGSRGVTSNWGFYCNTQFENEQGGRIQIDNSSFAGLEVRNGATFTNSGTITVGSQGPVGRFGIGANSQFINNAGGIILIDNCTEAGMEVNQYGSNRGNVTNSGIIRMGSNVSVGPYSIIVNSGTDFYNSGCSALLLIDSDSQITTYPFSNFTNSGTIIEKASGDSNIRINSGVVQNLNGGAFTIDDNSGLLTTQAGTLWTGCTDTDWNTASNWSTGVVPTANDDVVIANVTNKPGISNGTTALAKSVHVLSGATLTLNNCASLSVFGTFRNEATVTNNGFLTLNTNQTHTNTGSFINDGVLVYPQGNPIQGVTNNKIIAQSILNSCGLTVNPALQIGGSNNLTVGTTWYQNASLTTQAGTYAANTFTATNLTAGGTYPVFFTITDPANSCTRTISIPVTLNTPPTLSLAASGSVTCANPTVTLTASPAGQGTYRFAGPGLNQTGAGNTATIAAGGLYFVTVTAANGCTATATTTVESATNAVNATLVASGSISCSNPTILLTAAPAGASYAFSGPGLNQAGQTNTATASIPGTYSVIVTGAGGCTALATVSVTGSTSAPIVTINAAPAATVSQGQSVTLTANGATAFLWNTGATTAAIQPPTSVTGSTVFSVTATGTNGCTATAQFTLTVLNPTVFCGADPATLGTPLTLLEPAYNCNTGQIQFRISGGNGAPVTYAAIGITAPTTSCSAMVDTQLAQDIRNLSPNVEPFTILATQNGITVSLRWDARATCAGGGGNTPPTLANAVGPQSATVGVGYSLNVGSVFTDSQTPASLVLSAAGLPAGLALTGNTLTGTPSLSGVSTITLTATDPGGLTSSTSFQLTVSNPASQTTTPPPSGSALAATLVSYNCSAGAITFGFSGGNGAPVEYLTIGVTGWTTNPSHIVEAGLRLDPKPITIRVRQNGVEGTPFLFDFGAFCAGNPPAPPSNTPPTVANAVGPQSATVGVGYSLNVGSVFTDAQTPGSIVLSASGLPAGLSLNGSTISGTPSASGVSTVILTATDGGSLSNSTSFVLTVSPVGSSTSTPPVSGPLAATVVGYNCQTGAITFGATGGNGSAVEYFAIGITGWTSNPNGTIEAGLRADPKPVTIRVRQNGVEGTPFVFDFGQFCSRPARIATEALTELEVVVLGNPTSENWVDVEVANPAGEAVQLRVVSAQGRVVSSQLAATTGGPVRQRVQLGTGAGTYLLQVATPTRQKTVKVVRQ